jgi:hypothetical protein
MDRHLTAKFMDPDPTTAAPAVNPGAFVVCPVLLLQGGPVHSCLCQSVYQLALQQALQQAAPPRRSHPRFSWN